MCEDVGDVMGISDYPNIRGEIGGSSGLGQQDGDGDDDNDVILRIQLRQRPLRPILIHMCRRRECSIAVSIGHQFRVLNGSLEYLSKVMLAGQAASIYSTC